MMFDRTDQRPLASQGLSRQSAGKSVDCDPLRLSDRFTIRKRPRISLGTPKLVSILAAALFALLMPSTQAQVLNCAANCKTCWSTLSTNCMSCNTGFFLKGFSCVSTSGNSCAAGYTLDTRDNICKRTINDIDNPCKPSTYNINPGATSSVFCQVCAPGQACETFALASSSSDCDAGYYCKTASTLRSPFARYASNFTPLPLDTTPITGVENWWKVGSDLTSPNGDSCVRGNVCGKGVSQMTPCTAGYYCPYDLMITLDTNLQCREGFYCSGGAYTKTPGNPFYTTVTAYPSGAKPTGSDPTGDVCRAGFYCPAGKSKSFACDAGKFMPYEMAKAQSECIDCPPGKYCDVAAIWDLYGLDVAITMQASRDCDKGYVCEGSSISPTQKGCGYDEFCVKGTLWPEKCAPEKYTTSTKADTCVVCSAGKRCQNGNALDCEVGTFCKDNKISYCPPGKYGTLTGQSTEATACVSCEDGYACMQKNQRFKCAAGFHCFGSAQYERPNSAAEKGEICGPGTYCQSGTLIEPTQCSQGKYCPNWGAETIAERCFAGFYCPTGSSSPTERKCEPGHYCDMNSSEMTKCPKGTFNEGAGAEKSTDCKPCPEGVKCENEGLSSAPIFIDATGTDICSITNSPTQPGKTACPTGIVPCPKKFYCPKGTDGVTVMVKECEKGYKCLGQRAPIMCEAGEYQNEAQQEDCKKCGSSDLTRGYYCDGSKIDSEGFLCPAGRYCPLGTMYQDQYPCPMGTFNSATGKLTVNDCTPCTAGYYCQFKGQTAATEKILERYHGNGETGHSKPDPYLCPQTAYCPEGSPDAIPCDDGYWTPSIGASSKNDCIKCQIGQWCQFKKMFADTGFLTWKKTRQSFSIDDLSTFGDRDKFFGPCKSGYICLEGSTTAMPSSLPQGYACPAGYFCPAGAKIERPCPPGFYQKDTLQGKCTGCPPGFYCPEFGMTSGITCEKGSFCLGTNFDFDDSDYPANYRIQIRPTPCPAGTYGSPAGSNSVNGCLKCEKGEYCDTPGQLTTAGKCESGFVCKEGGHDRPGPYVTARCPETYYCPAGTLQEQPCLARFYSDTKQQSSCLTCPPGFYCEGGADKSPCASGYYCEQGSSTPTPNPIQSPNPEPGHSGGLCPVNSYCEAGQAVPWLCPDGTKQPKKGMSKCNPCDDGFICTNGGIQTKCPAFHYCNGNTTYPFGKLCENGFYGKEGERGYKKASNCTACVNAKFCTAGRIVGDCAPGYICVQQADSHTPNSTTLDNKAYPCPLGHFCSEGALKPTKCPFATFTYEKGAKQEPECTMCQAGWYCPLKDTVPKICPAGHYCDFGVQEPTICPRGTYQPYEEMKNLQDCLPCKAGFNCNAQGIGSLIADPEKYICPPGKFCPRGYNIPPISCIAGSYIDKIKSASKSISFEETFVGTSAVAQSIEDCQFCPKGYYCPTATSDRFANPCPAGNICPAGSAFPVKCKPGFYCEGTGQNKREEVECPERKYCPAGSKDPKSCGAEQFCPKRSASPATRGMRPEDCAPGTYLNVNRCAPCEPGFVCDKMTRQKYPINLAKEGGYVCPPGHFCPRGTVSTTIKKCPVGTHRSNPKGMSISDCEVCPDNSAQSREGSISCVLCGRGSAPSKDRTTCSCVGAFRTWQETTNSCVCQAGYWAPVITEESQTSTQNLDCRPIMKPICPKTQFVNEENKCVEQDSCKDTKNCNGKGGVFDQALGGCFCNNVQSKPAFYCDAKCQYEVLKVYYTRDGQIDMEAGGKKRTFTQDALGEKFLLSGLSCPITRCSIMSQKLVNGVMVSSAEASQDFVDFWKRLVDPFYKSPYPNKKRELASGPIYFPENNLNQQLATSTKVDNSFMTRFGNQEKMTAWDNQDFQQQYALSTASKIQNLIDTNSKAGTTTTQDPKPQPNTTPRVNLPAESSTTPTYIEKTIQCIEPNDGVSFEVNPTNFPVYIIESQFNTDPNYDYGAFSQLEVKLNSAKLAISSFLVSFTQEGVFVFGDHQAPSVPQTIVLVTKDFKTRCSGIKTWPLTSENMNLLGLAPKQQLMREFDYWLHFIPAFFIVVAFANCGIQHMIESRIEAAELERRLKREKASVTLKKYFKKKEDKFDKVDYLGDMYKLIQKTVEEIKRQIAENKRRSDLEQKDNMNKMLKDKYSVMKDLMKSGGDQDIVLIKQKVSSMLANLRFTDGRSLQEVVESMKMQEIIKEQEAKLKLMEEQERARKMQNQSDDSFVSESLSGDSEHDSFISKSSKTASKDEDAEKLEEQDADLMMANAGLADDMLAHKAALKKKREEFIASMDENLSPAQRQAMIKTFDQQMQVLAAAIQKEQQDQDMKLQAKLNARNRKNKKIALEANKEVQDKQLVVTEIQDRIDQILVEKEKIEEKGVNTKTLKAEREEEYKVRIAALDKEQDQKIRSMREDYLAKIKSAKNPAEKEKLLEEMGRRLKSVEDGLVEEKKRQELQLQKMLKARQKKNLKATVKQMDKDVEELEEQIEKMKVNMDSDKAQIYAEKGSASGILDQDIAIKKQKIANSLDNKFNGFQNELSQVEKDDIEIHKTQLQMEKEKELNSAEAAIDEEVSKSAKQKQLAEQKEELRKRISAQADPNEKSQLMAQLNDIENQLAHQMQVDRLNQDKNLEEKRKKRNELLQLKKMQIECDQIDELNKKEVDTLNNKFIQQMDQMDRHTENDLEREVRNILARVGPGKEQALIVVNEAQDDLLERKLKILMSKQFNDLTKFLGSAQNKLAMENMIRIRKAELNFERDKDVAINAGMPESQLADKLYMLAASRDLEAQLSQQKMDRDREEREQKIREELEEKFCTEKKDMMSKQAQSKRRKLQQVMDKAPDNQVVQEVGEKLIRRIDNTLEDDMQEADKLRDANLERARMKIIAENEKQLEDLQKNLNEAMLKEEKKLDDQMNARKDQILTLKRQNLEERMKMAGEMTQEQIKELRQQFEREFNNLEKAITEEKAKQLSNMRSAMLTRRIAKERKRRIQADEEEAARSRAAVQKMMGGMAKAFRTMIANKMGAQLQSKTSALIESDDKLRARLAAWQRAVNEARGYRGGEDGEIWKVGEAREAEKAAKLEARRLKEQAKAEKDAKIAFTIQELYRRVMRVERLSEMIEGSGLDLKKQFSDIGLMNPNPKLTKIKSKI